MPSKLDMSRLLRSCGCGNESACNIAKKVTALYASSVVTFASVPKGLDHPNKMPFKATLLVCDEPSDKPPHGAQGHRILVRSDVAKDKLATLPGMAVNYDPSDMDEHETQHKVGVITKAWMEGPEVKIAGFVWKKDFPEAERDLKRKDLGTSMELADVYVQNEKSSVWELSDFAFTGATILKRDAAAYTKTSLAAAAKAAVTGEEGETRMAKPHEDKKRKVAAAKEKPTTDGSLALMTQALSGSIGQAIQHAFSPIVSEMKASNAAVLESVEELKGLHMISAAAEANDDDDEIVLKAGKEESDESDESDEMAASAESDESDEMAASAESDESDEMAANGDHDKDESSDDDDSDDYQAMEDLELDPADMKPGEVNKDATNKGDKTTVTKPPKQGEHFPGNVAKGRLHSASAGKKGSGMKKPFPGLNAAAETIRRVTLQNRKLRKQLLTISAAADKKTAKLTTKLRKMEASIEYFTDRESRRSAMPVELTNLAAKSGIDLGSVKASGQVLTVAAVDRMFANAAAQGINLDPRQRVQLKMLMEQEGVMENGEIDRNLGRN